MHRPSLALDARMMGPLAHSPAAMLLPATLLACAAAGINEPGGESGPAVGSFTLAPVRSYEGAYRNHSLNTWGGALLHDQDNAEYPCHMFASLLSRAMVYMPGRQQPDCAPGVDKHGGAICPARCSAATVASRGGRGTAHR